MGNCVGGGGTPENVFKVISINDDESLVQKGRMEVTSSELVYVDAKSKEDWHWPLKFLRKYGCDGDVFTFEAGRKCPGGEGLYAFSTKKANILFDMVARNINQGDLSPVPDTEAETSVMTFPPNRTSTTSPTPGGVKDQPSYTNIDLMGNPLPNGDAPESTSTPDPTKFLYREVVFDRPPEEHPKPSNPPQKASSYTQIDFDRTAELSERRRGVEALPSLTSTPHGRTSSTSTGAGSGSGKHHGGRRNRMHTYSGRERQGSRSESSFSSQSSLTESTRDVRSPPKPISGSSKPTPQGGADGSNPSMYQNVQVGMAQEQQYQNVQVGTGDVSQVFDSSTSQQQQQQPNYCNVSLTANTSGSSVVPGPSENGLGPLIKVNGDSMMTYAQLELSSDRGRQQRSMSSSGHAHRDTTQQQYTQLDFPVGDSSSSRGEEHHHRSHSHGRRTASVSGAMTSAPNSSVNTSRSLVGENIPEEEPTHSSAGGVDDETKVTYGVLNFTQMDALARLQQEQERQREQEQQQRDERERANTKGKKTK